MPDVADLRQDYRRGALERADLREEPVAMFREWIGAAIADELPEPNAVVVATVDYGGYPDARVVLLKGYDERGFVFYTNYRSAKGRQLAERPQAAMVFNWLEHERQVRIRGAVEAIGRDETAAYFHSRPKGSQIGAWASPQSAVIADRGVLEDKRAELEAAYAKTGDAVPVPPHWGGYRVVPREVEFWQGRSSRLHDRFRYSRTPGGWAIDRLAP